MSKLLSQNSGIEKAEWFTFSVEKIMPSLSSVKRTMGVPKGARSETDQVSENWADVCKIYKMLVQPEGAILHINDINQMADKLFEGSESSKLYERFLSAVETYLFLATIGISVEEKAASMMSHGEYLKGGILDAIASNAVEVVVDHLQEEVSNKVGDSCVRFSPGYGGWKLEIQPFFLEKLEGINRGISVNESFMFTPHKTVSGVILQGTSLLNSPCDVCDTGCCRR